MSGKTEYFAKVASDAARDLTRSVQTWTGFLTTVGRLYRYSYPDQLMIYAQRPDATAVAEYDLWNDTMHRYVKRGAKGIGLFDRRGTGQGCICRCIRRAGRRHTDRDCTCGG